jgi:hypothetical protein
VPSSPGFPDTSNTASRSASPFGTGPLNLLSEAQHLKGRGLVQAFRDGAGQPVIVEAEIR